MVAVVAVAPLMQRVALMTTVENSCSAAVVDCFAGGIVVFGRFPAVVVAD